MRFRILVPALLLALLLACQRQVAKTIDVTPDLHALQLRTFESLWSTVNDNYVHIDSDDGANWSHIRDEYELRLQEALSAQEFDEMMEAMLNELPHGSAWRQTREERIELATGDGRSYEGIGSFITLRDEPVPRIIILSIMAGSPAEESGIKRHDAILAIDGIPVEAGELQDQIERIQGPAGSEVMLTIRSPEVGIREVVVVRDQVTRAMGRVEWKMTDESDFGYFLFPPGNYEEMLRDFLLGMQALATTGGLDGLILDLRIVSIGETWPATTLLPLFSDGRVGETYSLAGTDPVSVSGVFDFLDSQELPIAILVGPSTSGGAEIFAAALQSVSKAVVIGTQTPGEVETVTPFFLPDGSRLFVATSSFRTIDGRDVGLHGIEPDFTVDADWDAVTEANDDVLDAAMRALLSLEG